MPPRDFVVTEKYVREVYHKLANIDTTYDKDERISVEAWRRLHAQHVFYHEPGAEDDEKDVRAQTLQCYELVAP